jgi:hypothetical protein
MMIQVEVASGLWHRVVMWQDTNVSEVHAASIFMVKMEAARSYTTRHHNPGDLDLNVHPRENLKFRINLAHCIGQ